MIYLACPYTHPDTDVQLKRVTLATKVAGLYIAQGRAVYSPLTHTHLINETVPSHQQPTHSWWLQFNRPFMLISSELVIIRTIGWDASIGIADEIQYFKESGKPISFFLPEFIGELPSVV